MKRLTRLAALTAFGLGLTVAAEASAADKTLRLATIAPKNSSWGKVYGAWQKAIEQKTAGRLALDIYYNGVQGNEESLVSKIRTGQIDGATMTSVGLSLIYKSALVLNLPGVITNWADLDKVRTELQPDLDAGIRAAGFNIVGWGDVGLVRQFSKGFEVRLPDDVKNKRPAVWRNEPMGPMIYATIGNVVPVPTDVMEMLPALRSGNVNVIAAPALAAEQLQWTPYLDHMGDQVITCAIGGLVFKAGVLEALPADLKATWDDLQKRASQSQTGRIRKLDDEAYNRLMAKMTMVRLSQAERDVWEKILRTVVTRLARGTFDKALVNKVLKLRGFEPVQ